MKKLTYFLFVLLLGGGSVYANPVSLSTAKTVATNYYGQTYSMPSQNLTLAYTEKDNEGNPVYYVFNVNTNDGFIIVSAEDAGSPIIAVSNEGQYVIPTVNNNVGYWMNKRKNEIISMRSANLQASSDIADEWNAYINNTTRNDHSAMSSVTPLCFTKWDQPSPYNAMCPHNSLTGCVATAMAQIMKFWAHPDVGVSSECYYDEISYGYTNNYGQLCAYFDTSHYVWASMPYNVTSTNKEVAKLMYDCGVAVNMDYDPNGSGAYVIGGAPSALAAYPTYFHYNSSTIRGVFQTSYSASAWISLLEGELNAHRPMQYQGTDVTNGGHSWVCDGYNTSNQFHMNWGWSGSDNGYFAATSLNPDIFDFTTDIGVIMGIEPIVTSVSSVAVSEDEFSIYPNPSTGIFTVQLQDVSGKPQISVYNVLGQEVYSSKIITLQSNLNLSSQAKGIYVYRVSSESGKQISTGRLVIQ